MNADASGGNAEWLLSQSESLELRLLLDAILIKYGYDFRNYARASLKRRIRKRMNESHVPNLGQMIHLVLHDTEFFETVLADLSINVTEMFRDAQFFRALREHVLPELANTSFLKIWHAGCSTGEEAYSHAIVLEELGLLDNARMFATDFNETIVSRARAGVYPLEKMREYTRSYQRSGGIRSFAEYYVASSETAAMVSHLKRNVVFAAHNLASDAVFGEMDIVICRNVLIYFDRELQDRVVTLFANCLVDGGFLCLGERESVRFLDASRWFESFGHHRSIYRRIPRETES